MDRKVEWGEGVFAFMDELLEGDLHGKRVLSLANATLGVMVSASLAVAVIGRLSIGFETGPPIGTETGPLWRRRLSPSGGAVRSRRRRAAPHCQAARYPLRSGSSVAS